jgi:cardiolipin synthase A/B
MKSRPSPLVTVGATAFATVAAVTLVRNFISGEKKIKRRIERCYRVEDAQFERSMGQLLGPPILPGNRVEPLQNGDEIFPAMLEAIASAERSVTFETFIFWEGEVAERFAEALAAKAREGVKVHLLVDALGCDCHFGGAMRKIRDSKVELEVYHLAKFARVNHRTHRKILVIDGRVGFTGGVGIGDEWAGKGDGPENWRDTHYRIEGPVVGQLQNAFMDNWMKTHADVLHGEDYFPELEEAGPQRCQVFKSSPMEGSESARLMFLLSIAAADRSIRIANAYFVPDDLTNEMLVGALQRGVEVEILVPGRQNDSRLVRHASRHRWGKLLRHGAKIHEFQPTNYHCKCMIIDGRWTSIGSANFDNRSFRLNDEANLNVLDREFAEAAGRVFEADLARSRRVSYGGWKRRPVPQKTLDAAAAVLRSQL